MASLTKASQEAFRAIKPWFGLGQRNESEHRPAWRSSFSSGAATLVESDHAETSFANGAFQQRNLKYDTRRSWSRTLRSVASLFYVNELDSDDELAFDSTYKLEALKQEQTPRKILSRTWSPAKSTGDVRSSRFRKSKRRSGDTPASPPQVVQDEAPTLDVPIPSYSLRRKSTNGSAYGDLAMSDPATYQSDNCGEINFQRCLRQTEEPAMIKLGMQFLCHSPPYIDYVDLGRRQLDHKLIRAI